jgi:hypothetical protein
MPAPDEMRPSTGVRSAPTSLLHLWKRSSEPFSAALHAKQQSDQRLNIAHSVSRSI